MLADGDRAVLPIHIKDQVPWDKAVGVVILVMMPEGEHNRLFMSTLTWKDVAYLSKQLDSHVSHFMGPMLEGV